jgi:hypothetical protein
MDYFCLSGIRLTSFDIPNASPPLQTQPLQDVY